MSGEMAVKNSKQYFPEIDICRGLGILLVVLGHALKQTGETNHVFEALNSVIYSFHMPMFFALSGFVAVKVLDLEGREAKISYIRGRAFRLLIPYFFVGLCYMPLKFFLSRYAVKAYDFSSSWKLLLGENPNTALWFLYVLFWISCICALFVTRKNLTIFLAVSGVVSLAAYGMDLPVRLLRYAFFFLVGMAVRCNYQRWRKVFQSPAVFGAGLLVFGVSNVLLTRGIPVVTVASALAGSLCCMFFSCRIEESQSGLTRAARLLGSYSMDIYILSEPFNTVVKLVCWNMLKLNYIVCTACCFLAASLLPIPVSRFIVRKVKAFRVLILGQR